MDIMTTGELKKKLEKVFPKQELVAIYSDDTEVIGDVVGYINGTIIVKRREDGCNKGG